MAGGYFDLPGSGRSSVSDIGGTNKISLVPRSSPLPLSTDDPNGQQTYHNGRKCDAGSQGKHRNAGILEITNPVEFSVDKLNPNDPTGSTLKPQLDRRGTALPQRPLPTANIPFMQERGPVDPLPGSSVEDGISSASAGVAGLTINHQNTSIRTERDYDISLTVNDKGRAISCAQERAQRLASLLSRSSKSPKPSPRSSLASSIASTPTEAEVVFPLEDGDEISMISFHEKQQLFDNSTDENETSFTDGQSTKESKAQPKRPMSRRNLDLLSRLRAPLDSGSISDQSSEERDSSETCVERPHNARGGVLSSILKLYDQQPYQSHDQYGQSSEKSSEFSETGSAEPIWKPHGPQRTKKWYHKPSSQSTLALNGPGSKATRPVDMLKRSHSSSTVERERPHRWGKPQLEDEIRITINIAALLSRQKYLIRLCRALMRYGAPTHRLEEYMRMTARVLEIDSQFLYIPGCMIISFDDVSTHTTEVKVVRSAQGIDLGKLADVHEIYKEVIHDVIGVEEAIRRLDSTSKRPGKFHILFLIFAHGCASACVGPFAFNARPIDMPIAFLLGCLLGILQLILSPKSSLYSNVFEISAAVLTSFLARAFGSIRYEGEPLFCFSALAQSAIALILPGYTVLCASLELQSRSIISGSVRMVYAIIYSLFLGFGITVGTAVYGILDTQASTAYTCPASPITNEYIQTFPFVLLFTACLAIVNQAKWRQIPVMMVISLAGYAVSYFSSKRFSSNTQVSNALGAFVIGLMGNFYSRLRHGLAAAAMLPAIWVLVPSGLAASGSLISGITSAEEMTHSPYAVVRNGTQGFVDAAKNLSEANTHDQSYGVVFDIGYGMVQVAIGTTVGLFLAALVVYPLGKKRSGLFSF
ncbi:hypothetical protein N7495_009319 [Penicillium taxi]|uniref:uncharacterized protein n=1 Tax=Penicillium taxi TaxID=168475 RepID=UPI0025458BFE|nr:uncharacterized protein N7495_009319 [Penicillium taxi]KAJ5884809.1 hypothetical protein N7495_009319 [Penicillium taxi]